MTPETEPLHPERALLTPTWLGALALLVANDHWLKGADLIPGVLTGKLSDFAGMLVAPTLLAALLRVRSRRGLLACHVAVGAVFSGIQLWPSFAGLWSGAMGLLGHPWAITCDPTDLLALPFLALSWSLLTPAMAAERPALVGLRRTATAAASVFGLWATVATSDDGGSSSDTFCGWECETGTDGWDPTDETGGGWEEVYGQVYVHNPNDFPINLNIRLLRPEVRFYCEAIASDPGRLLVDDLFGEAEHWELPPTTNVAVLMEESCGAAKIAGEGIAEQIVFSTSLALRWHPGSHDSLDELDPTGAAIVFGDTGSEWVGGEYWRHTPKTDTAPLPEECVFEPTEQRLDWSELPSSVAVQVQAVVTGLDGCYEVDLLPWSGDPFTWYLCAPESAVRFEVGEDYRLTRASDVVEATLIDPILGSTLEDDLGRPVLTLRFARDQASVTDANNHVEAHPLVGAGCPFNVDDACTDVTRRVDLSFGEQVVVPGVPVTYSAADQMTYELSLGRARELALLSGECSSALPYSFDYALVSEPTP